MAPMRKQDWTTRIPDVWVLMTTDADGESEVEVYLTEELAMGAMVREMMRTIRGLKPEKQAHMRQLLAANDFNGAAIYWEEYSHVSYSWNEHRIITE